MTSLDFLRLYTALHTPSSCQHQAGGSAQLSEKKKKKPQNSHFSSHFPTFPPFVLLIEFFSKTSPYQDVQLYPRMYTRAKEARQQRVLQRNEPLVNYRASNLEYISLRGGGALLSQRNISRVNLASRWKMLASNDLVLFFFPLSFSCFYLSFFFHFIAAWTG